MSDHDKLRDLFRSLSDDDDLGDDCPEPERILAAVHGLAESWERDAIIDHTVVCSTCAEAWRAGMRTPRPATERVMGPRRRDD